MQARIAAIAEDGVYMGTFVVLAVCLDPSVRGTRPSEWRSAGYTFIAADSVRTAIGHLKRSDFDLVLLGHSIPMESRERLTFLIRARRHEIPVASIADAPGHHDAFADATFEPDSTELLLGMGELLKGKARIPAARAIQSRTAS